jgi:hypothetical protein
MRACSLLPPIPMWSIALRPSVPVAKTRSGGRSPLPEVLQHQRSACHQARPAGRRGSRAIHMAMDHDDRALRGVHAVQAHRAKVRANVRQLTKATSGSDREGNEQIARPVSQGAWDGYRN